MWLTPENHIKLYYDWLSPNYHITFETSNFLSQNWIKTTKKKIIKIIHKAKIILIFISRGNPTEKVNISCNFKNLLGKLLAQLHTLQQHISTFVHSFAFARSTVYLLEKETCASLLCCCLRSLHRGSSASLNCSGSEDFKLFPDVSDRAVARGKRRPSNVGEGREYMWHSPLLRAAERCNLRHDPWQVICRRLVTRPMNDSTIIVFCSLPSSGYVVFFRGLSRERNLHVSVYFHSASSSSVCFF